MRRAVDGALHVVRVAGSVTLGRNVWVSFAVSGGCYVQGGNGVEIGDDTMFAPGVKIVSANHDRDESSRRGVRVSLFASVAGAGSGANAVILPGVQLGDGCTVGAGAVVTKSFPAGSTVGGVPARLLSVPAPQVMAAPVPAASIHERRDTKKAADGGLPLPSRPGGGRHQERQVRQVPPRVRLGAARGHRGGPGLRAGRSRAAAVCLCRRARGHVAFGREARRSTLQEGAADSAAGRKQQPPPRRA